MDNKLLDLLDDWPDEQKENKRSHFMKGPFRYAGSKLRSLKYILPHLPYHKKYIEVFGGTGVVLINRERSDLEVFNDRFSGITDFYRCLRNKHKMEEVEDYLTMMLHSREEFIRAKEEWCKEISDVVRAAKWYYSMQFSFSGMGKAFGRSLNDNQGHQIRDKFPLFDQINQRIKNILIENLDWRECIKDFDSHDAVFYLDPPYMPEFSHADKYEHTMSVEEHKELCNTIFDGKGFFALSGYENSVYNTYPWDKVIDYEIRVTAEADVVTETNNKLVRRDKEPRKEFLYIKEAI